MAEWIKVKEHILNNEVQGFHTSIMGPDGRETVYIGGAHKQSAEAALKAALRVSAARVLAEDVPPRTKVKKKA